MSAERWAEVDALFKAALRRPTSARLSFLRAAQCEEDVRAGAESLLEADAEAGDFLETPAFRLTPDAGAERSGRLGPYRLIQVIGRGGMGDVYLAERDDGAFERRVAVKILRPDVALPQLCRRMDAERRILARLEHPNIARLYDGGTTDDGRPFLVLEYVEGEPIDAYSERLGLDIDCRIELFLQVCDAVQLAHRNLLIHRDLKPLNILVTVDGTPKLLDFGIAKPLDDASRGFATELGATPLTPAYASPEQLRGEPLTTASDVFSLGVILRQLVTRRPPNEQPHASRSRPKSDLDVILATALHDEPERRYSSARQLAEDLERFRAHRPILARPDRWLYRLSKLVRRHKLGTALALTATVTLLVAAIFLALQARMMVQERDRATTALDMFTELLTVSDPHSPRNVTTLADFLAERAPALTSQIRNAEDMPGDVVVELATTMANVGLYVESADLLEATLAKRRSGPSPSEALTTAALQSALAATYRQLARYDEAESLFRSALGTRSSIVGGDATAVAETLTGLGDLLAVLGRASEAKAVLERAVTIYERGDANPELAGALTELGDVVRASGDIERSEALFARALELNQRLLGPDHFAVGTALAGLARVQADAGRIREAYGYYRQAIDSWNRSIGAGPDLTVATAWNNLALASLALWQLDEAEEAARKAYGQLRALKGDDHPGSAIPRTVLAKVLVAKGDDEAAVRLLGSTLSVFERHYGEHHPRTAGVLLALGKVMLARGDDVAARELLARCTAIQAAIWPEGHRRQADTFLARAELARRAGDLDTALDLRREALDRSLGGLPAEHWRVGRGRAAVGSSLKDLGRLDEARRELTQGIHALESSLGADHPETVDALALLQAIGASGAG